jgi:hypothetical protein
MQQKDAPTLTSCSLALDRLMERCAGLLRANVDIDDCMPPSPVFGGALDELVFYRNRVLTLEEIGKLAGQ